jgi:hypothetical protein
MDWSKSMRKALIGILLAATVAAPAYAAPEPGGRRHNEDVDRAPRAERQEQRQEQRAARQEQRVERQAAPQEQRVERQAAPQEQRVERQAVRQEQRVERQAVRQEQRVERQQSAQPVQQSWQGRGNRGNGQSQQAWQGRGDGNREAYQRRIEETRAASAASAAGLSPAYQRRAAQNQARTEERLREQRRDRREDRRDWRDDRRDDRRDWDRDNRRGGRHGWNHDWRRDSRYDWQRYRYSNRNIFRRGGYYAPYRNHRYNRLSIGLILSSAFFGQNYWISDPWHYRLPPAYPGTRWVRYYDDVLLIDVYSGEVIDVIYDFFW